jgi:hypothetical protein
VIRRRLQAMIAGLVGTMKVFARRRSAQSPAGQRRPPPRRADKRRGQKSQAWWIFQGSGRTLLLAIILLLAALVLRQYEEAQANSVSSGHGLLNADWLNLADDLLKELGVALLIAVVIVEGIERLSRREQNEEVSELIDKVKTGVLEAVYGTEIATIFFSPFRKVIDHPLLRKECDLSGIISLWKPVDPENIQDNDVVLLDLTLKFVLKNCSKEIAVQNIPAFLEKPWPDLAMKGIPDLGVKSIRVRRANGATEEVVAVTNAAPPGSKNDLDQVAYEIRLDDSEVVTVIYAYRFAKYARDSSSLFSTIPTESMRFNFIYDQKLSLYYTNVHERDFFDETPSKSPGQLNLRSDGPLFPANGIEF